MWDVAPRDDRYEILDRSSEDTLCRGQLGVWVGGVTVLQDGLLECVGVKVALWVCVIHPYLSPAVGMWECNGREAMVYPPVFQKLLGGVCTELWSSIGGAFVWDAVCGKGTSEAFDKASRAFASSFDDGPVGVSVHYE